MTRRDILEKASLECLKELYTKVQPAVTWEDFLQQNKKYSKKYEQWERLEDRPNLYDYCGPRPCEFYYLPKEVMKEICDSYVDAYKIDNHQNLLDIIEILNNYFEEPIVDAWIEEEGNSGYRGYEHPDNLHTEFTKLLRCFYNEDIDNGAVAEELIRLVRDFFDKAGEFYSWNHDLNAFNTAVYLGPSPCSNKETVIKNWKQYRDKTILINDSIYIEDEED